MHRGVDRYALQGQQPGQGRDQDQPAADAQQPGEHTGHDAEQRVKQPFKRHGAFLS